MNRAEYMRELAYLLQDLPDGEKEEALQYYEDYFDDAGPEKEAQVIGELGSPERLAAIIREGAGNGFEAESEEYAEYTENGYCNDRYREPQYEVVPPEQVRRSRLEDNGGRETEWSEKQCRRRHGIRFWICAVIGMIFLLPFLIGGAAVFFGLSVVLFCMAGGVMLAVIVAAAALVVAGLILAGVGIGKVFAVPLAGMAIFGVGLILLSFGVLAVWLAVLLCGKAVPGILHMIGNFLNFVGRRLRRGGVTA